MQFPKITIWLFKIIFVVVFAEAYLSTPNFLQMIC